MRPIVTADIGGTHARFAIASIDGGHVVELGEPVTLRTADHASFQLAWQEFGRRAGADLPNELAIAFAGPVGGDVLKLTNNPWMIRPYVMKERLGVEQFTIVNDFGAVAHAVATAPADQLIHITGPEQPLPESGTVSVIGPGTGLGVAHFHRYPGGYHVQATEGGHVGFCPQDEFDDRVLALLRARHGRVATERVNAGPGIEAIYTALGGGALGSDRAIWEQGLARQDVLAAQAVERFCASLGSVAGDYALAHGASAVVLAGGLGLKLRDILPRSDFGKRFGAKPRYEQMMAGIPVKLIVHPQPGLYGAAAAFALEHLG